MHTRPSAVPYFLSFFLGGAVMAYPGTVLDHLLANFGWSHRMFGFALLVQGAFVFLGTRLFSSASLRAPVGMAPHRHIARLASVALLVPALGTVLVYGLDAFPGSTPPSTPMRLLGHAVLGFGLGASGILNNAFALRSADPPRLLNVLNMAFTAGAMLVPAGTGVLLALVPASEGALDGSAERAWLWRAPLAIAVLGYVTLSAVFALSARNSERSKLTRPSLPEPNAELDTGDEPVSKETQKRGLEVAAAESCPRRVALVCACTVLFCYVGSEINLSNTWMPFLSGPLAVSPALARLSSPIYWSGLFIVRLYFSLRVKRGASIAAHLVGFGAGVLAVSPPPDRCDTSPCYVHVCSSTGGPP